MEEAARYITGFDLFGVDPFEVGRVDAALEVLEGLGRREDVLPDGCISSLLVVAVVIFASNHLSSSLQCWKVKIGVVRGRKQRSQMHASEK